MKSSKKILILLLIILSISTISIPAFAAEPLKVAVLPPLNTAKYQYFDDIQLIQTTIQQPFKYPYYSLLPNETVLAATTSYLSCNKSVRLSERRSLEELANKLSADIIVVAELATASFQRIDSPWIDETYIDIDVALKCYAYSSATKQYDVITVSKWVRETESITTNSDVILKDLAEEILAKLPYKRIP